jgi:hypothetical protein
MMDRCRPDHAAVDYTTQACIVVITTLIAAAVSGFTAGWLGYTGHFVLSTLLSFIGLIAVMRLTRSLKLNQ